MKTLSRVESAKEALELSLEVREDAGEDYNAPINVFDLCGKLTQSVRVHFVDWSMEGCYHRSARPLIEVSALRPLGRRVFNCAHELGHHVAGHGSTIDELKDEDAAFQATSPEEYFANTFAGFLLMPKLGVRRAFTVREWQIATATPKQFYVIACHFGVGYTTLVKHLAFGLREISNVKARDLSKVRLPVIRRQVLGSDCANRLVVVDQHYQMPTVDCEVGTHLLLPYFARLVGYGTAAKPGESEEHLPTSRLPEGGNQLEFIIQHCRPGVRRAMLQAAIDDPVRDQDASAQKPFPCLQHVTFVPDFQAGTLALNAFYATQQLFVKGYGNWLGLVRLGVFVASQVDLRFATMSCFAGIEKMDMRPKAGPKLEALRSAAEHAIATEASEPLLN